MCIRDRGYDVPYDKCGNMIMVNMPTQGENIKFFFSYQLNWMYWRYFMWNFAGRQNDIQGSGEIEHGKDVYKRQASRRKLNSTASLREKSFLAPPPPLKRGLKM